MDAQYSWPVAVGHGTWVRVSAGRRWHRVVGWRRRAENLVPAIVVACGRTKEAPPVSDEYPGMALPLPEYRLIPPTADRCARCHANDPRSASYHHFQQTDGLISRIWAKLDPYDWWRTVASVAAVFVVGVFAVMILLLLVGAGP